MYDRSKCIGASDAVHIQAGKWAELWDRKTSPAAPEYPLAAELGHRLESFNIELFERETGHTVDISPAWQTDPLRLDGFSWCTYLPDGLVGGIPFEAKAINMIWKPENLLNKYMPQLQHAMRVTSSKFCYFSVIYLNTRYEWTEVAYDPPYDDALFEKECLFQWMLEAGRRPPEKKGRKWL